MNEHDSEPVPGLPARLPKGETLLWQGAPEWRSLARRAFHVGHVAAYFAILLVWYGAARAWSGGVAAVPLISALELIPLALVALAVLGLLAWLTARTTVYTITDKRVVMRYGIALPISINLPFAMIDGAGLRLHADASGDIPLVMKKGRQRVAWMVLWPHARPWRLANTEPMLRCVPDAVRVAQILARALAAAAAQPAPAVTASAQAAKARPSEVVA